MFHDVYKQFSSGLGVAQSMPLSCVRFTKIMGFFVIFESPLAKDDDVLDCRGPLINTEPLEKETAVNRHFLQFFTTEILGFKDSPVDSDFLSEADHIGHRIVTVNCSSRSCHSIDFGAGMVLGMIPT